MFILVARMVEIMFIKIDIWTSFQFSMHGWVPQMHIGMMLKVPDMPCVQPRGIIKLILHEKMLVLRNPSVDINHMMQNPRSKPICGSNRLQWTDFIGFGGSKMINFWLRQNKTNFPGVSCDIVSGVRNHGCSNDETCDIYTFAAMFHQNFAGMIDHGLSWWDVIFSGVAHELFRGRGMYGWSNKKKMQRCPKNILHK